jgi:hypothetical protein
MTSITPTSATRSATAREQFQATGEVRDAQLALQRKDGSKLDVSLNVSALRDADGRIVRARMVWRDITARKQADRDRRFLTELSDLLAQCGRPAGRDGARAGAARPALERAPLPVRGGRQRGRRVRRAAATTTSGRAVVPGIPPMSAFSAEAIEELRAGRHCVNHDTVADPRDRAVRSPRSPEPRLH